MSVKVNVLINGVRIPHLVKFDDGHDENTSKTDTWDGRLLDGDDEDIKFSISGVKSSEMSYRELKELTNNVEGGYPVTIDDEGEIIKYTGVRRTSIKRSKEGKKRTTYDLEFEAQTVEP